MKWAPSPPALVRAFARATARLRGVEHRTMFGYPAIFVNGNMVAGLVDDRMVVRLSTPHREELLAERGAAPFVAMQGRVMKQWALVPPAMVTSPRRLGRWLTHALAYGRTLPAKPIRRSRPRGR